MWTRQASWLVVEIGREGPVLIVSIAALIGESVPKVHSTGSGGRRKQETAHGSRRSAVGGGSDWSSAGRRPRRLTTASLRMYSICPLTLRSSCWAHSSRASYRAGSIRIRNAFLSFISPRSGVERAGVDHRVDLGLAAEDDHQVAHHRRPAVLVELDDALVGQVGQSHLDHADCAVDDLLPRRDDRLGLLPP